MSFIFNSLEFIVAKVVLSEFLFSFETFNRKYFSRLTIFSIFFEFSTKFHIFSSKNKKNLKECQFQLNITAHTFHFLQP